MLAAAALLTGGCGEADDGVPPGGEPFVFAEWLRGVEYLATVDLSGESRPAASSGLTLWTGTVTALDWTRETLDPEPSQIRVGDSIEIAVRDEVDLRTWRRVRVTVDSLLGVDSVVHLTGLVMDEALVPLPGSLGGAELETALADTGVIDRSRAMTLMLDTLTR